MTNAIVWWTSLDLFDQCLMGALALLGVGLLGLLVYGLYAWLDTHGCPDLHEQVEVRGKHYTPPSSGVRLQTVTTSGPNGQMSTTLIPVPYSDPASYQCCVRFRGQDPWVRVSESAYAHLSEGKPATLWYRVGRWSKKPRLRDVLPLA